MRARITPLRLLAVLTALCLPALLHAGEVRTLSGAAHNVTVGVRAAATMQIARHADGAYGLSGGFDNVNLAGDVSATGHTPRYEDGTSACAPGHECIIFTGQIMLDSRTGFPDGTVSSFDLTLDIETALGVATGAYRIGLLPGFAFEQYGTITLTVPTS